MELKVLGTVAPYPKDNMNCSSFLIREKNTNVMLDAGFGSSRKLDILKDLRNLTIIISHYHPDHYGDLLAIANQTFIAKKLGYLESPVDVYLPKAECGTNLSSGNWMTPVIIPSYPLAYDFLTNSGDVNFFKFHTYDSKSKINLNDTFEINFKKTIHPLNTYSAKIIANDGEELVYSSDTGYENNNLAKFADGASTLICEATYLLGQNKGKDIHLYAKEAGMIASNAGVKQLYLFHTFPEIDKNKYVLEAKEYFNNVSSLEEGEEINLKKELKK